jgi:hypothetical protein
MWRRMASRSDLGCENLLGFPSEWTVNQSMRVAILVGCGDDVEEEVGRTVGAGV